MNHLLDTSRLDRSALARQIELLVARVNPMVTLERRRDQRVAMPVLFRLTPLDADHQPLESQTIMVVGKNVSRRGMSFYHNRPLPYRRALIAVEHSALDGFAAEIDVSWCRFTKPGWYESGGRLIAAIAPRPAAVSRPADAVRPGRRAPSSGRGA